MLVSATLQGQEEKINMWRGGCCKEMVGNVCQDLKMEDDLEWKREEQVEARTWKGTLK